MSRSYTPAERPTFYFIGVTTGQSSIMRVFPEWARCLELGDCEIRGLDFPIGADTEAYREAVTFIRDDPLSLGALVTTHKIDLFNACHDLFDNIDSHAELMGETSCLSKRNGQLVCHAKDPISSGLSLDGFLPRQHFVKTNAALFIMGAGGSAMAMTWHLTNPARAQDRPYEVIISDPDRSRLAHIESIKSRLNPDIPMRLIEIENEHTNDRILEAIPSGSLVVNATGLGKDRPGSPLTRPGFPEQAIAWDLNYRGNLEFLEQARTQQTQRRLQIEDGWSYFIHGWSCVIAEVFNIDIPSRGPVFDQMSTVAREVRRTRTPSAS